MTTVAYPFSSSTFNSSIPLPKTPPLRPIRASFSTSSYGLKNSAFRSSRLRISHQEVWWLKVVLSAKVVSCYVDPQSSSDDSQSNVAKFDLKLPRRRLLVQFTCDDCGERTERLVNRLAYERGTVFVQCAGCLKHHQLVDNLGLIVEYDLRKEAAINEEQMPPSVSPS